jgi:hypothetical protein
MRELDANADAAPRARTKVLVATMVSLKVKDVREDS